MNLILFVNILLAMIYILVCYFIGSIPTGVWYSKAKHQIDIRTIGSGNSGATNVGRHFGLEAAIGVTAVDVIKGALAAYLALRFFPNQDWILMLSGLAVVIGHAFPVFADFRGGKIVATSIGVLLVYHFPLALIQVIVLFALLYITSIMSFSSLVSFGGAVLYIILASNNWVYQVGFAGLYLLMLYRHRTNILRLISGEERMLAWGMQLQMPFDTGSLEGLKASLSSVKEKSVKGDTFKSIKDKITAVTQGKKDGQGLASLDDDGGEDAWAEEVNAPYTQDRYPDRYPPRSNRPYDRHQAGADKTATYRQEPINSFNDDVDTDEDDFGQTRTYASPFKRTNYRRDDRDRDGADD